MFQNVSTAPIHCKVQCITNAISVANIVQCTLYLWPSWSSAHYICGHHGAVHTISVANMVQCIINAISVACTVHVLPMLYLWPAQSNILSMFICGQHGPVYYQCNVYLWPINYNHLFMIWVIFVSYMYILCIIWLLFSFLKFSHHNQFLV